MRRAGPMIAAVVSLLVALLVFVLMVRPKMQEVGERRDQLEAAETEQVALEAELERLRSLEQQAPELRRKLARLRREIPPVADLPGLIVQLQQIADLADVEFFSVSPGQPTPTPAGTAAVVPAEVQVVGGFFSIDEFLFRLETLPRAAKVTSIAMTEGTAGEGAAAVTVLNVALSVEFYTTDSQAGPGAPVEETPEEAAPDPEATPSPESPSPSPTPSPTPT